jgi:hypothetical protein
MPTRLQQGGHEKSAYEWPRSTIVIVVWQIERTVILAPVRISRTHYRRQAPKGPHVKRMTLDEIKNSVAPPLIGDPAQNRQ